jgi:uncharacterized protein (DUF2141 family)
MRSSHGLVLLLALGAGSAAAEDGVNDAAATATGPVHQAHARRPDAASLNVIVTGIAESRGQLLVTVFTSAGGWPKPQRAAAAARVTASAPYQEVRFDDLPAGPCAVSVVHDLDGNGKLTMRWFPFPSPAEPTGASNGATGTLGPPSFERARFDLPPRGGTVRISLGPP